MESKGKVIAKQRQIIDNLLSIEGSILNMKQNNKNKQNIFDELHKEIADLKETNTKLHNRILTWKRHSPVFSPLPRVSSDAPEFIPKPSPERLPPHPHPDSILFPKSTSDLRY